MGNLNIADAPGKEAPELSHNYLESLHLLALLVLPFLAITQKNLPVQSLGSGFIES